MKIIFLDFDGVLHTPYSYRIASGTHAPPDPACVAALNHLTDSTGALIVVSSTWRLSFAAVDLRGLLRSWGVAGTMIGTTERLLYMKASGSYVQRPRWQEIQRWIDDHEGSACEAETFGILDDEGEGSFGPLTGRLIQTAGHVGLTMADAERAAEVLTD